MAKDYTIYGTCTNRRLANMTDSDAHSKPDSVCIWRFGKLVRSFTGDLIGVDAKGRAYIKDEDSSTEILVSSEAVPVKLPGSIDPDVITARGWLVTNIQTNGEATSHYTVSNGKLTVLATFAPEEVTPAGHIVGWQYDNGDNPIRAMIRIAGRSYDLSKCVVNIPHHMILTEARAVNSHDWILARTTTNSETGYHYSYDVLLKPIGD